MARPHAEPAKSQRQLAPPNGLDSLLRHTFRSIVRSATREQLAADICGGAVEHGGLSMAWIGWHDPQLEVIIPAAHCGDVARCLGFAPPSLPRTRIYAQIEGSDTAPAWQKEAFNQGYRAVAFVALVPQHTARGVLALYSVDGLYFGDAPLELLQELAAAISFGFDNLIRGRDITIARQRAETADVRKSEFLATMSHELRTPLHAIIGFCGVLLQEMAGPVNAEQSVQLETMRGSAWHLFELINNILDISKIDAGQLELVAESFDLDASIESLMAVVRPLADKKGLSLQLDVIRSSGMLVADRRRVAQVLLNLLSNAIKFTEHGGVTLTVDTVIQPGLSTERAPRAFARLRVADTGPGISEAAMHKLFLPFQRTASEASSDPKGCGLGLTICRRLAELLGGDVQASSELGSGSVFTFTLPLQAA